MSFIVGFSLSLLGGGVTAGVIWGRLTSKLQVLTEQVVALNKAISTMDRGAREEGRALHQRWHDANTVQADHELRLALLEREMGVPFRAREDRTPIASMRRARVDTGPHGTGPSDTSEHGEHGEAR